RAIDSSLAWDPGPPRIASDGSPPAARSAKNTRVATTQATSAAAASRPASQRSTLIRPASGGEPRVDEGRGRDGPEGRHAAHPAGEEVVLLVVEREDVEPLEDLALDLGVQGGASVGVG